MKFSSIYTCCFSILNPHSVTLTEVQLSSSLGNSTKSYVISKRLEIFGQTSLWDLNALYLLRFWSMVPIISSILDQNLNQIKASILSYYQALQNSKSIEIVSITWVPWNICIVFNRLKIANSEQKNWRILWELVHSPVSHHKGMDSESQRDFAVVRRVQLGQS